MIVKLLPDQVARFWDALKHGAIACNHIKEDYKDEYARKLLEDLLSDKAQGWVGFEEVNGDKTFYGITITSISPDSLTRKKCLNIQAVYGFRPACQLMWDEWFPTMKKFAENSGCTRMFTYVTNPRLKQYLETNGMTHDPSLYAIELGGSNG